MWKSLHLVLAIAAKAVSAAPFQTSTNDVERRSPQSSGLVAVLGSLNNLLASHGKKKPSSEVEERQSTKSIRYNDAITRKVRYGPYRVPPTSERNVEYDMLGQSGMTNTFELKPLKPCDGDCILLSMQAGLEYANGTEVPSTTSGAVLHHTVVINRGVEVWDATCGKQSEHIFESGNEKVLVPFYMPEAGIKAGYHLRKKDNFAINTELMNMENQEKWVWLTLSFDVVEGFHADWKESKVVWVSVGPDRCSGSVDNPFGQTNLTATQQPISNTFEEYSPPWISPKSGYVVGSNSHLHNGGIDTELYIDGNKICTSNAKYSKGAGGHSHGAQKPMPAEGGVALTRRQMGTGKTDDEQLSDQEQCTFTKPQPIAKGDSMYIKTHYDFNKHAGVRNQKGELDEVMAITGVLMVFDYEVNTEIKSVESNESIESTPTPDDRRNERRRHRVR